MHDVATKRPEAVLDLALAASDAEAPWRPLLLGMLIPAVFLGAPCAMAQPQQPRQPDSAQVLTLPPPPPSVTVDRLQHAAQELREAIQAMGQQAPGPGRDRAMAAAEQAILQTQEAIIQLPPEMRTSMSIADAQRQLDEARRLLQGGQGDLRRVTPAVEEALLRADRILQETGRQAQSQQRAEQLLGQAEEAVQRGDRDAARQALRQVRQSLGGQVGPQGGAGTDHAAQAQSTGGAPGAR